MQICAQLLDTTHLTSSQFSIRFYTTKSILSLSAPASAVPSQQTFGMQQPIPNDPISAFPPRNLFAAPSQPHGSDEQQQPDPFDDDLDLSGELGVFEQLDAIKFLLHYYYYYYYYYSRFSCIHLRLIC